MIDIPTSRWKPLGETANTRYFVVEPHVLAAVPHARAVDDQTTARENVRWQNAKLKEMGGGVVLVFFDLMTSQDKEARRVYQTDPESPHFRASALIGGSMLGRAIASFFLGLTKPRIPVKLFGNLDDALAWARQINLAAGTAAEEAAR